MSHYNMAWAVVQRWCSLTDSNRLPPDYKTGLHRQSLESLVRLTGFEPARSSFGGKCSSS